MELKEKLDENKDIVEEEEVLSLEMEEVLDENKELEKDTEEEIEVEE